jgi:hypothetical protein
MATAHSIRTAEAYGQQSSSGPQSPASRDSDETSPLLRTNCAQRTRSPLSAFFDENAGLLLVAASQFFFSAMNTCVKWLNSLDEPVPMLEVRLGSRVVVF